MFRMLVVSLCCIDSIGRSGIPSPGRICNCIFSSRKFGSFRLYSCSYNLSRFV